MRILFKLSVLAEMFTSDLARVGQNPMNKPVRIGNRAFDFFSTNADAAIMNAIHDPVMAIHALFEFCAGNLMLSGRRCRFLFHKILLTVT